MEEKDRLKAIELYFDKMKSFEEIEHYFKRKYTYAQIRSAIMEQIK